MSPEQIIVVDDEESILELLQYNLSKSGFAVSCCQSGEEGLQAIRARHPDCVILDLMLPGMDGLDVCKALKNDPATNDIPIIMLTAKGDEADVVIGLELGADDYVTKPFSLKVLLARVKAQLRRKYRVTGEKGDKLSFPDLIIDKTRHEVMVQGDNITLTHTEFQVLTLLAEKPGRVFTRNQIIDTVRGGDYPVTDRSVDVQIVGLRKKLGSCGHFIETVRSVGYRFKDLP